MDSDMTNQCDDCRRGLPLLDGIHYGEGWDVIGCTANRYGDNDMVDQSCNFCVLQAAVTRESMALCNPCAKTWDAGVHAEQARVKQDEMDTWTFGKEDNIAATILRNGVEVGHIHATYHPTIPFKVYWLSPGMNSERANTHEECMDIVKAALTGGK